MIKTRDIAWSAGIFEGEGWCGVTKVRQKGGSYMRLRSIISMTDEDVVCRLKAIWGIGCLSRRKPQGDRRKEVFTWEVTNRQARQFLLTIATFLGERRLAQMKGAMAREGGWVKA